MNPPVIRRSIIQRLLYVHCSKAQYVCQMLLYAEVYNLDEG